MKAFIGLCVEEEMGSLKWDQEGCCLAVYLVKFVVVGKYMELLNLNNLCLMYWI